MERVLLELEREHHGEMHRVPSHAWTYFSTAEEASSAAQLSAQARGGKKAIRTYTNQDVERQNQQNGLVKRGGKTERLN